MVLEVGGTRKSLFNRSLFWKGGTFSKYSTRQTDLTRRSGRELGKKSNSREVRNIEVNNKFGQTDTRYQIPDSNSLFERPGFTPVQGVSIQVCCRAWRSIVHGSNSKFRVLPIKSINNGKGDLTLRSFSLDRPHTSRCGGGGSCYL